MRTLEIIVSGIAFLTLSYLYIINVEIPFLVVFASFIFFASALIWSFDSVQYHFYQFFGIGRWVHPIIKLSIMLIKLDGVEKMCETKRMIQYLNSEFEPETAKVKLMYYKKHFNHSFKPSEIFFEINESNNTGDKVRILRHLVKIALSDRLLTDKEAKFIELVADRIKIPNFTLKAILNLYTYVTEEDIKNQQTAKPSVNHGLQRAYSLLGLESTASFEEVKSSYRELVKIYHPDKQRGSKQSKSEAKLQFQAVSDAYDLIKEKKG